MSAKKQGDFSPCFLDWLKVLYLVDERRVHPRMQDFDRLHKLVNQLPNIVRFTAESITKKPPSHNQVQGRFLYNFSLFFVNAQWQCQ